MQGRHCSHGRREVEMGRRRDFFAELLAQMPRAHLLDRAFRQSAELERPERHADQPVHRQAEMAEHVLNLAVLAFAHRKGEPDIVALLAVEPRFDRPIADAVEADTPAQRVEFFLSHAAVGAHPIAAHPAGRRQFEEPRQPAVIGEQQQPFGVHVEPPDAEQARQALGQRRENGRAFLRVDMSGHEPARLVIEEQPRALALRQRLAVDHDQIGRRDIERRRADHRAIDRHPPVGDPGLCLAA